MIARIFSIMMCLALLALITGLAGTYAQGPCSDPEPVCPYGTPICSRGQWECP